MFVFYAMKHRELLISFRRATGQKPQRIIFYRYPPAQYNTFCIIYAHFSVCPCRDGVSEGQFYQVLLFELDAIRKVIITYMCNYFC